MLLEAGTAEDVAAVESCGFASIRHFLRAYSAVFVLLCGGFERGEEAGVGAVDVGHGYEVKVGVRSAGLMDYGFLWGVE